MGTMKTGAKSRPSAWLWVGFRTLSFHIFRWLVDKVIYVIKVRFPHQNLTGRLSSQSQFSNVKP